MESTNSTTLECAIVDVHPALGASGEPTQLTSSEPTMPASSEPTQLTSSEPTQLTSSEPIVLASSEPTQLAPSELTHDDVIASIVEFSRVISNTLVELQGNLCKLLQVVDTQGKEIAKLKSTVDDLVSQSRTETAHPAEVTLSSVLSDADSMRATDEYDSLLKKIEARKNALSKSSDVSDIKMKTHKEIEVENAKKMLLERARHHAKMTSGIQSSPS